MNIFYRLETAIGRRLTRLGFDMRAKLIAVFVLIIVIPLSLITIVSLRQFNYLGSELKIRTDVMKDEIKTSLEMMGDIAVEDSITALNNSAITQLERASTDMANRIADFLYRRDDDILYAAELTPNEAAYRRFLLHKTGSLIKKREWVLAPNGNSWIPKEPLPQGKYSPSLNTENDTNYRNRPPDPWETEDRPLYLEMTYLDLAGNEIVKVTTSGQMDPGRKNISNRLNTYAKAETYFNELRNLRPGQIYVSDVIGTYVGSRLIGMYTPKNTTDRGIDFQPEEEAYAGKENPNGKCFKGIIRWATPVTNGNRITGYVTLALDHDHVMEFVDRITPMEERYTEMPSAFEGNYAFIWDYLCRSIAHPRHHSIVGFNSETGEPEVPWLEERIYNEWQASGQSYTEFIKHVPTFDSQSREKRPSPELTSAGLVGLDGRYLNNAPQCIGWMNLTEEGGSGSFLILWSGIWKPNTAAAIPYYTGNYGKTKRGFGFVAIGAGLEDFQQPALETKVILEEISSETRTFLDASVLDTSNMISLSLKDTTVKLGIFSGLVITLIVFIAIWIASSFSSSINNLIKGISRFRGGERRLRFNAPVKDEIGMLADSFDDMADSLVEADRGPIVISDMNATVVYVNDMGLTAMGKKHEEIVGRPYAEISFYPADTVYDPIKALWESRETDIFFHRDLGCYFKGEASYLTDKDGRRIGYIITSTDVTELIEQQHLLEEAVAEAKLANEHKGNFLARMSHEIRTPMNAIIGMTGIVRKKLTSESYMLDDVLASMTQIEASSKHLLGLLNDILDFSKIEAEKIELATEDMDLLKLVLTVAAIIEPRCIEKNIIFEKRIDLLEDKFYKGDSLRLRQVLINLLGNAVKFTPENGKITYSIVLSERKNGKALVYFSVKDTGIGIPDDTIELLFKPFQQADSRITKKFGGTGLGLAISKSIVQMFGGDIDVNSTEGKGSEFSFSIWLEEVENKQEEEIPLEDITDRLKGKKALIVDDVDINRIITASMLEPTGITVDEADDGEKALKLFSESAVNEYNIIYMDIQMPVMDGYEASRAIRALNRPDAKTVAIVALTANAFKEDIEKAVAAGMNAHLAKPMEMEKLMEVTFKLTVSR